MAIHQNAQAPGIIFTTYFNETLIMIRLFLMKDQQEREFIRYDKYMEQIFGCSKMKFAEIPQRLNPLLHPPDPIVINHLIR